MYIKITEEMIHDLKLARKRILDSLKPGDLDALEIFTLNHIIEQFEKESED